MQQVDQWHASVGSNVSFHIRQLWFSVVSNIGLAMFRLAIVMVIKRLANFAVRAGIGMTTTVGRFSNRSILTWTRLPSGSQKKLVILRFPKLIEIQLQLKITLLSGVFVCECEIDTSSWCIEMMDFSFTHSRSPGMKMSVAKSHLMCL